MITFEVIEIINDVLELEDHNLELISLDALEEELLGSHDSKYSLFRNFAISPSDLNPVFLKIRSPVQRLSDNTVTNFN